jgi:hypothetical protein
MPSLCERQSLRSTKTFDSDRCLCFQLDKHEVEWGGTIKKEPRFPAPKPHSGEISTKYLLKLQSLAEKYLRISESSNRNSSGFSRSHICGASGCRCGVEAEGICLVGKRIYVVRSRS